jgi:hypothetical protein
MADEVSTFQGKFSALLRDWAGSTADVFFDFCEEMLWWLSPRSDGDWAYVARVSRAYFIETHRRPATPARDVDSSVIESSKSVAYVRQPRQRASVVSEQDHLHRFGLGVFGFRKPSAHAAAACPNIDYPCPGSVPFGNESPWLPASAESLSLVIRLRGHGARGNRASRGALCGPKGTVALWLRDNLAISRGR